MPAAVRESLAEDYAQVQAMLDKLEHGHIHIAVFGRVSVGKSATLNALLGEQLQDGGLFRASADFELTDSWKLEGGWLVPEATDLSDRFRLKLRLRHGSWAVSRSS